MQDTGAIGSIEERSAQLAIELRVSNLTASVRFYETLGFTLARHAPGFAAVRWDDRYLLLSARPGASAGPTPPNLRLIVADVEVVYVQAREQSWTVTQPLADRGYGLRDFVVADPDGYEVRFAQLTGA